MKLVTGFLILCASLSSAWPATPGSRDMHDYPDSLRNLPPRMRPFFDKEYRQQVFNAPLQESLNVRCVGRWPWGPSYEVTAQRDTLYLASGSGVRIVDITTPTNPRHIGQVCARGLISQVVVRDSLLYVSCGGLEIFSVSDPANPVRRSWFGRQVRDFGLKDSFAVCISDSLRIINVRDPGNPFQVGASADSGYAIFVTNNYAYIGSRWELAIINITNPQSPRRAGARGAYVHSLWVQGNHCYTATGDQGFTIFNIRDTSNIWEEGRIGTLWSYDVYVIGMFAYTPNFAVIDISDSSSPAIVGSVNMPCGPFGVWVKSPFTYGFVADWYEGLQVVNINDPTTPRIDTAAFKADAARDVFVQGNRAYIADDRCGMKVLDISNIQQPFEIGYCDTIGPEPELYSLWTEDTLVYLGDDITRFPPRFAVVNAKDPRNIIRLGSCRTPGNISAEDMFLKDSIVYSVHVSYLYGYKINNPNSPTVACSLLVGGDEAYGVFVKDSFAYVAGGRTLKIVNIANLSNPRVVGSCSTSYRANAVFVKDAIAYVVSSNAGGLYIFNVADPSSPFLIAYFLTRDSSARDVWIDDTLAYIATWRSFQVVNVKNPANPFEVGYYTPPTSIKRIFYDGRYIYGAAFEGGMIVFERFMTGIEESDDHAMTTSRLRVYPNPARSRILFSGAEFGKDGVVRVFDITGRESGEAQTAVAGLQSGKGLDISGLKSGVYFFIIEDRGHRAVFKVIKL